MFGLPLPTVVIIVAIAGLALSMIPWQKLAELKASIPEIPDNSKTPDVDHSAKYLEAQKKLLEIRVICKDCPEATAAIDTAIKATVAMVVKPKAEWATGIANDWTTIGKVASMQAMTDAALASPLATAEVKQ